MRNIKQIILSLYRLAGRSGYATPLPGDRDRVRAALASLEIVKALQREVGDDLIEEATAALDRPARTCPEPPGWLEKGDRL